MSQIFFETESAQLDTADLGVLTALGTAFERVLRRGNRVELIFIGYADYRASNAYNRALSSRRAVAVRNYLGNRLSTHPLYSAWDAWGVGEQYAAPYPASRMTMATDRRVDVVSRYVDLVESPPILQSPIIVVGAVPRRRRLNFRRYEKHQYSMNNWADTSPDPTSEAIEAIGELIGSELEDDSVVSTPSTLGNERMNARRVALVPATWTVNEVRITIQFRVTSNHSTDGHSQEIDIEYEWGPPSREVRVHVTQSSRIRGRTETTRRSRTYPRSIADRDPLLFPPDPGPAGH